ncbi:MAG: ferredoxin [Oscillospiraceae bacterium]
MNVHVNENCIGCGLCVNMCGSVFLMTEEGVAAARDEIFPEQEGQVRRPPRAAPSMPSRSSTIDASETKAGGAVPRDGPAC